MPDLTPEHFRRCTAIDHYSERVRSRSDPSVIYHVMVDHCDCPGFVHRQDCRHVRDIVKRVCMWGEVWSDGSGEQEICPRSGCGKPTHGKGSCDKHCPVCGADTTTYVDYV